MMRAIAFASAICLGGCWLSEGAQKHETVDVGDGGLDGGDDCGAEPELIADSFSGTRLARAVSQYEARQPVVLALPNGGVVIGHYLGGASVTEPGLYLSRQREDGSFDEEFVVAGAGRDGHDFAVIGARLVASYFAERELRIAFEGERSWEVRMVQAAVEPAAAPRSVLAVDAEGHLHVAYLAGEELRYASDRDGTWRSELVASAPSLAAIDLAVDGRAAPHITFEVEDGGGLRYAEGPPPFRISDVTSERLAAHALALDADDHAHIGLLMLNARGRAVHHADNAGGAWRVEKVEAPDDGMTVLDNFGGLGLALDGCGDVRMAAIASNGLIHFARRAGSWSSQRIPSSRPDGPLTMAVDAAGAMHLAATAFRYPNDTAVHYYTNRSVAER